MAPSVVCNLLTAALLFNAAFAAEPTPMERVINLLTQLRSDVDAEGVAEATTYDAFACFCKDTMASKTKAISDGETERDGLEAKINGATVRRDTAQSGIKSESASATQVEGEIETNTETTRAQNEDISKNLLDVTKAVQGLDAAIAALQAAETGTAFLNVKSVPKEVRQALSLVEVLGTSDESALRVVNALSEDPADTIPVPAEYAFHATDVIATLKGLRTEFTAKKNELVQAESDLISAHKSFVQNKETILASHKTAVDTHKENTKLESAAIATASQDLTTTSAQLLDDQTVLSELSSKCSEKAQLWDMRTQTRANEITAITQALTEIQAFQTSLGDGTGALLQTKRTLSAVTASSTATSHLEPPAFVQLASSLQRFGRHLRGQSLGAQPVSLDVPSQQTEIVDLLRMKAETFKSALLLKTASQVAEDPFAKVKGLIQTLIERLLKEQADEASHKGWCDKEVSVATIKRDKNAQNLKEVNSKMAVAEAHRAKLTALVASLDGELKTVGEQLTNATNLRTEEKVENAARVTTAQQGFDAVNKAIDILDKFYKTAAKQTSQSFVQRTAPPAPPTGDAPPAPPTGDAPPAPPTADAAPAPPDAGFSDAYTGSQGAKEGVVGMLEVVRSDFSRTIAETQQAESTSAQEFLQLETTLGMSQATKQVARKDRSAALLAANAEYSEDETNMAMYLKARDSALQQLKALYGPCLSSGGISAEDKKIQREEEMAALNQALCILDQHGVEGVSCD